MIKSDERRIKKLIKENNKAKMAFDKMYEYFKIMDKLEATTHLLLINRIYVERDNTCNTTALSLLANIGERTCYRYREQYIDCFYLCLNMIIGR